MTTEATDPRGSELTAEHLVKLKEVRLKLCELVDDPIDGVRPYFETYQEIMDIIASIEKLLGVK